LILLILSIFRLLISSGNAAAGFLITLQNNQDNQAFKITRDARDGLT